MLLGLHLVLVQYHGMSVPPSVQVRAKKDGTRVPAMPFVPHFALRDLFGWTVALALLAGLSAYLPWELGHKADPFASAPAGIAPEWYFLWTFQALKYMPAHILGINGELVAVAFMGLRAAARLFLPFLDRHARRSDLLVTWASIGAIAFMAAMTALAIGSDQVQGGVPFASLFFIGLLLFALTLTMNLISERFVRKSRKGRI